MLGTGLDIMLAGQKAWWQAPARAATEEGTGISRLPASIASFRLGRYAVTNREAASIAAASADALTQMQAVGFSGLFSFTRASNASFIDAGGNLQIAASDVPRFDHTNGKRQLLLEGASANAVLASEMTGFTAGRRYHDGIGNVGVLPTGMSVNFGGANTGYVDLISVITDSRGRKRLRLEFNIANATGSTQFPRFRFAEVAGVAGELWSASVFVAVISSSHTVSMLTEAQTPTGSMQSANLVTGDNTIMLNGGVFPSGGQTMVRSQFGVSLPTGQTWTAVIDVACPQLEKSPRCTSYIPTTGTAATRAADNCQFGPKALALIGRTAVGIVLKGEAIWGPSGNFVGCASSRIVGLNTAQTQISLGNASAIQVGSAVTAPLPAFGTAVGWDGAGKAGSYNGAAIATSATPHDATFTSAFLGRGSGFANGWYDEFVLYPFRPSGASLVAKAVAFV
ncbi:hypothetical protein IHQ71_28675 [Rhizobium sp. TH2]|uniref:phage head spike fiber domain-containing protein n=1 Tax=Rhizobium sp. TH2 TaxID=2775403 RepID=UPI0021579D1A|nr:hypothetical protein [Rhizobium sp. TH2]UVC09034.1 hypothetical protein IHQ71_28675 [Rhizobium sp. TH2]